MNRYIDSPEPVECVHYAAMAFEDGDNVLEFPSGQTWPMFWNADDQEFYALPFATFVDIDDVNEYAKEIPEGARIVQINEFTTYIFLDGVVNCMTTFVLDKDALFGEMITDVSENDVADKTFLRIT